MQNKRKGYQMRLDDRVFILRRINSAREDAERARPLCDLVFSTGVDEDGYVFLHISCLRHGSSWRELCAVVDANEASVSSVIAGGLAEAARAGACAANDNGSG